MAEENLAKDPEAFIWEASGKNAASLGEMSVIHHRHEEVDDAGAEGSKG